MNILQVFLGLIAVLLIVAVNFLLLPYLLMIVLGAFGVEVPFVICVAIFILLSALIGFFK